MRNRNKANRGLQYYQYKHSFSFSIFIMFSACDRFEEDMALVARGGRALGCYRDSLDRRLLAGFVR